MQLDFGSKQLQMHYYTVGSHKKRVILLFKAKKKMQRGEARGYWLGENFSLGLIPHSLHLFPS